MAPQRNSHHSLPTVDEILANVPSRKSAIQTNHRKLFLIGAILTVAGLSVIIGLSVSLGSTGRNKVDDDTSNKRMSVDELLDARYNAIVDFLDDYSNPTELRRKGSPQQLAAQTLHDWNEPLPEEMKKSLPVDNADLVGGIEWSSEPGGQYLQRYALIVFYHSMNGGEWRRDPNFMSDYDKCTWNRLFQGDGYDLMGGVACFDKNDELLDGEVTSLVLPGNRLSGELPSEIGLLTSLQIMILSDNTIIGTLPVSMRHMKSLTYVELLGNSIRGPLSPWIGDLTKLEALNLGDNKFTGSLPSEIGLLASLQELHLEDNKIKDEPGFSGQIPLEIMNMKACKSLRLGTNSFSGTIPNTIGTNMAKLEFLRLSNNDLGESIPASFASMTNLRKLYIDGNKLTGNVDSKLRELVNLEGLYMENNRFDETVSSSWLRNLYKLQVLDASGNDLKGVLPAHFFSNANLEVLDLHDNDFSDVIPEVPEIVNGTSLKFLSLSNNLFGQTIPPSIANLKALEHLDLSSNRLDGTIPSEIGLLSDLTYLFMGNEDFDIVLSFPEWARTLTNLKELSLEQTSTKGTIPLWIGELTKLVLLDLRFNRITGVIPTQIGLLTDLRFLLLTNNRVEGPLPSVFQDLDLQMLLLEDNYISGSSSGTFCVGPDNATRPFGLDMFQADCYSNGVTPPKFECPCCTECCDAPDNYCTEKLQAYKETWESTYDRNFFYFRDDETDLDYLAN